METKLASIKINEEQSVRLIINKKFITFSIISMVVLSIIALAQTEFQGDSNFGVEINVLDTDEYGIGVYYNSNCLTECNLPLKFKYNGTDYPTTRNLTTSDIGWNLIQSMGDTFYIDTIQWMDNITYTESVYNGDTYQEWHNNTGLNLTDENSTHLAHNIAVGNTTYINKNDAYNYLPSETVGWYTQNVSMPTYVNQDAWRYELINFSSGDEHILNNNEYYLINYVGKRNSIQWGDYTDVIPEIYGLEFTEAQWFNVTFNFRFPIIINQTFDEPVSIDIRGGTETLWTRTLETSFVYSINSGQLGEVAVANLTTEKFWENETDNMGNQPTKIYEGQNLTRVFHMNENNRLVNDSVGIQPGLFVNGTPLVVTGIFGNAIDFQGRDYIILENQTAPINPDLPLYTSSGINYSVSLWVKNNTVTDNSEIIYGEGAGFSSNPIFAFQTTADATGAIIILIRDNSGSFPSAIAGSDLISNGPLFTTGYHHICWTDDNGDTELYIDGVLDTEDMDYTPTPLTLTRSYIAINFRGGFQDTIFDGSIDEVRLYNEKITQEECQRHFWDGIDNHTILGAEELLAVPPEFVSIEIDPSTPATYVKEATYQFNVTWNQESGITVNIEHNFTGSIINESLAHADNISSHVEVDLPAGTYQWRQFGENTGGANSTPIQIYTVNKATPSIEVFIDGVASDKSVTRSTQTNVTAVTITGEGTSQSLTRNGNPIGTGTLVEDIDTLPGGTHDYQYTHPETANFTTTSLTRTVTVSGFSGALGGIFNIILLVVALGVISQGIRLIDEEPSKEMLFIAIIGLIIAVSLFGILVAF